MPSSRRTHDRGAKKKGARFARAPLIAEPRKRLLGFLVFLVVLLGAARERGAEDVAEAGAGVLRAVLLHRLLLLLHLAGFDGERDLAGRTVHGGDLGVHLLADGETVRTLLAAV